MTRPHKYSSVVLGFAEDPTAGTTQPANFASKAGGLPVWLYRSHDGAAQVPKCGICNQRQRFLAQIYAPVDVEEVGHEEGFHRVLYVCLCENVGCQRSGRRGAVSVLRAQLRRRNEFYGYEGGGVVEKGGVEVCELCGFKAEKMCGGCRRVSYCSRACQVADWKCGHKESCAEKEDGKEREKWRFREIEIVTEAHPTPSASDEEESDTDDEITDSGELTNRKEEVTKLIEEPEIAATFQDADEDELPEDLFRGHRTKDAVFERFQKVVAMAKAQVIRYERGGRPLLVRSDESGTQVEACEVCGADRAFELQIMPQLAWYLKDNDKRQVLSIGEVAGRLRDDMDWGTILVFCCGASCEIDGRYSREVAIMQQMVTQNE